MKCSFTQFLISADTVVLTVFGRSWGSLNCSRGSRAPDAVLRSLLSQ